MSRRSAAFVGLALLLTALPAAAVDSVLYRGIDPWTTDPVSTSANFLKDPLPMGFFCADFPGFDGQIWLRGVTKGPGPQVEGVRILWDRIGGRSHGTWIKCQGSRGEGRRRRLLEGRRLAIQAE